MVSRESLGVICLVLLLLLPATAAVTGEQTGGPSSRAAQYLLGVTSQNATQKVNPASSQKSATFGFQVKNTGDSGLPECNLQLTPWTFPPDKWSYNFIPPLPFIIYSGETKTILMVISPAQDAEAKRYTFQLDGKAGVSTNSISVNLDVLPFAGVEVRAPPAQDGPPGETLEFNFEIINTGNSKDKFNCSVVANPPGTYPSIKDNDSTVDILPGGSVNKTFQVILPYDLKTTEGTPGIRFLFTAWSNLNTSVSATNWTYVRISHIYDLSLGVSPPNVTLFPGELAEFTVTTLNLGNGYDNITLKLTASFAYSSWTVSIGRNWFNLSAGRMNTTKLRITPPLDALAGNHTFKLVAISSGPPPAVQRAQDLRISVRPVYRYSLPPGNISAEAPVLPGGVLHLPFNFTNVGNADDVVRLELVEVPEKWNATVGPPSSIPIRRGATEQAMLNVQAADDPAYAMAGDHFIKVRLSNSDGTFVANLTFRITVGPVYDWSLTASSSSGAEVNLFVTHRQSFLFDIANRGNIGDEVSLSFQGPFASWGRLDSPIVPLGVGEKRTVMAEVLLPADIGAGGTYSLVLSAASRNRPELHAERTVSVDLRYFDPSETRPTLTVYPAKRELTIGEGGSTDFNITVACRREDVSNVTVMCIFSDSLGLTVDVLTPPGDLKLGENRTWTIRIRAPHADRDLEGFLSVRAVGDNQYAQWEQIPVRIKMAPTPRAVVSMEGLGVALGIFLALGGLALGWNEVVLFALVSLFLPLYSKIRREEILDQYTRGKIHGYIIANPGEHYNSLKAQLKLKNGTLAYHLRVLEREGFVKSARDGPFKRFYPQETAVPKRKSEFSSIQEIVLENIRASPGITQNDLARKMGVSSQVVNYHVRGLVTAGTIRLAREGRITRCYLK